MSTFTICPYNSIEGDSEITIEIDPSSFDLNQLKGYIEAGINRVSLGGQSFEDNVLSIEVIKKNDVKENNNDFTRFEFDYNSFKRSFTIPESVEINKIDASYLNGILNIKECFIFLLIVILRILSFTIIL